MLGQGLIHGLIIFLSLAGLAVSGYLHYKKKRISNGQEAHMLGRCKDVITSKYSRFLGVDVEVLGAVYYSLIVVYGLYSFTGAYIEWLAFTTLLLTAAAAMFSTYLALMQAFHLEDRCFWCSLSNIIPLGLLALFSTSPIGLEPLMAGFSPVLLWFSVVGAAVGLGASIAFDVLYLTYLKDFEISEAQAESLNTLTHLIWAAIGLTLIGMAGLVLGNPALEQVSTFQASAFVLGTLILTELVYSLYLADKMSELTFADLDEKENSFLLASISTASWTVLLTLQILELHLSVYNILAVYMAILAVIGLGGLLMNSFLVEKAEGKLPEWSPLH